MTPLELELESFTCYRERTKVSWQGPECGLFAVTGPTGAGKSTLLDAITYALYGQTPRLGGRGLESLLSPGATSMFVQLTFRAAKGVHRVTRVAQRRAGGVSSEVRLEEAVPPAPGARGGVTEWRQDSASERVRDANRAVEELVGLDYAGFTRAVLLPQGAFDEFLRGDAGERRRLLVSLLGLDRVERVRELAGRLGREAEASAAGLRRRLEEDYAEVTANALRDLGERLAELEAEAGATDAASGEAEAHLAAAKERARLDGVVAGLARRRAAIAAAATEMAALGAELEAARRARLLEPVLRAQETAATAAAEASAELAGLKDGAAAAAATVAAAAAALAAAKEAHADRAPVLERRLEAVQGLAPALATLRRVGGSLVGAVGGEGAWLDEDAWSRLQVAEGQLPELERAEADLRSARERAPEAAKEQAQAAQRVAELERELEARAEEGKALKAEADRLAAARQAAVLADAAAAVRAHVHVGDDCPVCGNAVAALPASPAVDAVAAASAAAGAAERALEAARAEYARVRSDQAAAKARHEAAVRAAGEAAKRAEAAGRAHSDALGRILEHLGQAASGGEGAFDARRAVARIAAARAAAVGAHATALVGALAAAGILEPARFDLARGVEDMRAELRALAIAVEEARSMHEAATRAAQRATDLEAAAQRRADEATAAVGVAKAAVAEAMEASGFANALAARAALRSAQRLEELSGRLEEHALEVAAVERGEDEARTELAALPALQGPDGVGAAELAQALQAELVRLRARRTELASVLGSTRDRLATAGERLERKRELADELKAAEAKAELHRQLATDLRGDRFQEYLMTNVQQRLARRASATLRHVTDGRYDLHLLDGDYLVADAWAGGEFRSARTLSGGESFVASLALALALSDTLAGNAALGALFLDEGFGTLDRATLDSVADVLEALTDEGRMVGVITHVTGLSERLPARLVVTKGQRGSSVAWDS